MNTTGKWLSRAGSLLILLGFFLPSMAVSCTAIRVKQAYSLSDLAASPTTSAPWLFLILLGALAMIGLSFVPGNTSRKRATLATGQLICLVAGVLILFFTILSLYSQINNSGMQNLGLSGLSFSYSLEYGFVVLVAGFLTSGAGIILQYFEGGNHPLIDRAGNQQAPIPPPYLPDQKPVNLQSGQGVSAPHLEIKRKGLPDLIIPVMDNFCIGRSRECELQLPDRNISRLHARLRFGQGAWFIQDQTSSTGISVNGKRVQAIQVKSGDQITIGSTILVFRM